MELVEEVKSNLPKLENMFENPQADQVLEYLRGIDPKPTFTHGNLSCFAGVDVIPFFNGVIPNVLDINLYKDAMSIKFVLGPESSKIAMSREEVEFSFVGLNDAGYMGIISGKCKPVDFHICMGTDVLSVAIMVHFNSRITVIDGWTGGDYQSNLRIRQDLNDLYDKIKRAKGIE